MTRRDENILKNITDRLANVTDDENDDERLRRVSDAKTIELFRHYQNLGKLMFHDGKWESTDYSNRIKYIDAIMDFDCGNDDFCKENKEYLISKSSLLHREPQTTSGGVFNMSNMNFEPEGGRRRKVSKKSSRKKKSRKSRKTKSRRH